MRDQDGYYNIEGLGKLPSVTTILQAISKGMALNKWYEGRGTKKVYEVLEALKGMSPFIYDAIVKSLPEDFFKTGSDILKESSSIGSSAHALFDKYMKGEKIEESEIPEKIKGVMYNFFDTVAGRPFKLLRSEATVYSEKHRYAGTLDAIIEEKGKVTLLDWKTSNRIYHEFFLQGVAYKYAAEQLTGQKIDGIEIFRFGKEAGDVEVRTVPKEDHEKLFQTFLHVYEVWKWMEGNKK